MEEVVVLRCTAVADARRALHALHHLHHNGAVRLDAASVVGRHHDGRPFALEQRADERLGGAPSVTECAVVGLLSGPFGLVLENAPDALVGSLVDIADVERSHRLLRCLGDAIPPGSIATIALVSESAPATIDGLSKDFGGVVVRRPRNEVELSIACTEDTETASSRSDASRRCGRLRRWIGKRFNAAS